MLTPDPDRLTWRPHLEFAVDAFVFGNEMAGNLV